MNHPMHALRQLSALLRASIPSHINGSALLAFGLCSSICISSANAASATWSLNPTTGVWEATTGETNWSTGDGLFPGATGTTTNADIATFTGASATTTVAVNSTATNSLALNLGGIAFTGATTTYTIGASGANLGNALLFSTQTNTSNSTAASIYIDGTTTAAQTINAPLLLVGNAFFNNASTTASASLNIAGAISGNTTGSYTLTLRGATAGGTISGNITNGSATSLTVGTVGTGTWTLTGAANNFSTLSVGGGTVIISAGSTTLTNAVALQNNSGVAFTQSGGELTTAGFTINSSAPNATSRVVSLNGGTTKLSGNVFASGVAGNVSLGGGTLQSNNAAGIHVYDYDSIILSTASTTSTLNAATGSITVHGTLDVKGTVAFTGSGSYTNTVDAISYSNAGATVNVNSGTVNVASITTNANSNTRFLNLNGGTLQFSGSSLFASGLANSIVFAGGTLKSNNTSGITVYDDNNAIVINAGGATFDTTIGNITLATGTSVTNSTGATITFIGGDGHTFAADSLTLANGTPYKFNLSAVTIGNATSLATLGTLNVTGTTFSIDFNGALFSTAGTYNLLQFSNLTGNSITATSFTATNATFAEGITGAFSLTGTNLSYVLSASAVPEPATWGALAGIAGLGLAIIRRRRSCA